MHNRNTPDGNRLTTTGIVYKKTIGNYIVHFDGRAIACSMSTRLRKQFDAPEEAQRTRRRAVRAVKEQTHTDPIAVGDHVQFLEAEDGSGMITEVLPRRNRLSRRTAVPMPGAHAFEQVIVANIDQVVPVFAAANPVPRWNMLDRYLVAAESFDLEVVIVITKMDLARGADSATDDSLEAVLADYRLIGYPVVCVSSHTGEGLDMLRQTLGGRVSALVGKSGVGKSSLLNAIQPGLGLRVKAVNQVTGKGRHTTSHLEMFALAGGGAIVDTPGTREFGLWDVDGEELAHHFREMRPYLGRCRFGLDCRHDEEPGCAVRQAVAAGKISPRRYQSYARLKAGEEA